MLCSRYCSTARRAHARNWPAWKCRGLGTTEHHIRPTLGGRRPTGTTIWAPSARGRSGCVTGLTLDPSQTRATMVGLCGVPAYKLCEVVFVLRRCSRVVPQSVRVLARVGAAVLFTYIHTYPSGPKLKRGQKSQIFSALCRPLSSYSSASPQVWHPGRGKVDSGTRYLSSFRPSHTLSPQPLSCADIRHRYYHTDTQNTPLEEGWARMCWCCTHITYND